jgi:predicted amidohydrolase
MPEVKQVSTATSAEPVSIAVVTGPAGSRRRKFNSIQDNIDFYAPMCESAAQKGVDLIVLPEIALQYGLPGSMLDFAVAAPGPETEVFAEIARRFHTRILLGMVEQDGDAAYNSAVLINPDGEIDGKYRKVHFAVGNEVDSGLLPGDSFPVFDTEVGRLGCNICMDTSAAESSRLVGLGGADFLLMPIMGDFRAHDPEDHSFDADRFRGIMQTRAMDNQLCMVVSVNQGEGSCIIDRMGNVLAWNDGEKEMIQAEVLLDDGFHPGNRGCAREVTWMLRRPHVYEAFADRNNTGSMTEVTYQ